ncbi:hypothetical protein CVU76_02560 [Candidatus Dojkabacteria bacterium HGW-Dojkabacteria-1]|uniref:Uncharacterized protein n=1 Tax=Candidatus Dojkabacteria bacterium HGW-Dojkabacteria-1 TaxID=2013761 RepID=A0A2N2F3U5_9BACT|nr:MAG: hypothetical protein CVU76_02560 [Candidatus Dojkabacteria bacterium HGW-Dojkabacteria-1]
MIKLVSWENTMDPKDTNFEQKRESYFDEEIQVVDYEAFYADLFQRHTPEQLQIATDRIKEETSNIEMGSTTKSNLERCETFLSGLEIDTKDNSQARDISILRVLKMVPGLCSLQENESEEFIIGLMMNTIHSYVLGKEKEFYRDLVTVNAEGTKRIYTYDQHMRENGCAINIQRNITDVEMGRVLAHVRDIVEQYINSSPE